MRSAHPIVHTGHRRGWRVVTTPVLFMRRRLNSVGRTVPTISSVLSMTLMGLVLASGVVGGGHKSLLHIQPRFKLTLTVDVRADDDRRRLTTGSLSLKGK